VLFRRMSPSTQATILFQLLRVLPHFVPSSLDSATEDVSSSLAILPPATALHSALLTLSLLLFSLSCGP
jgi:hypothetical protein